MAERGHDRHVQAAVDSSRFTTNGNRYVCMYPTIPYTVMPVNLSNWAAYTDRKAGRITNV